MRRHTPAPAGITMRFGQCHVKRWIDDILPAVLDVDLPELHHAVLPALRARGLLADQSADTTFRSLLGLDRPSSRYTTDRSIHA